MFSKVFVAITVSCVLLNTVRLTAADTAVLGVADPTAGLTGALPNATTIALCGMRTNQFAEHYGYDVDEYTISTSDDYIMTIFRIRSKNYNVATARTVILSHGMLDSSDAFGMDPTSLSYSFADQNYDVHAINYPGNTYSRVHKTLNPDLDPAFWAFDWHEMADKHLPAVIDHILAENPNQQVFMAGHSQGATVMFIFFDLHPEYNDKIKAIACMAPFTYMPNVPEPMNSALNTVNTIDETLIVSETQRNFELARNTPLQHATSFISCSLFDATICISLTNALLGESKDQKDPRMMAVHGCKYPAGGPFRVLLHFAKENRYKYYGAMMSVGQKTAPTERYNMSEVKIPVIVLYSLDDPHTTLENKNALQQSLNNCNATFEQVFNFNHLDYIWAQTAKDKVYDKIIAFFKNY